MNNTLEDNDNIYSEDYLNKINKFVSSNYCELYLPKNLCDINIEGKWTVGVIKALKRNNIVEVNDYLLSKKQIEINCLDKDEISYFRKYTKPNENKRKCLRNDENSVKNINTYFLNFINFNFGKNPNSTFNEFTPYDYLKSFKRKIILFK